MYTDTLLSRLPFLRSIAAAPDDDAPRLVYADFLEEAEGRTIEPRLIRAQVGLARTPPGPAADDLRQQEKGLLADLAAATPAVLRLGNHPRRGLIDWLWYPPLSDDGLEDLGEELGPVEGGLALGVQMHTYLRRSPVLFDQLGRDPRLAGVLKFRLFGWVEEEELRTLAASPHLANLEEVDVWNGCLTAARIRALSDAAAHLPSLRRLEVSRNRLGRDCAAELGRLAVSTGVTDLSLMETRLRTDGLKDFLLALAAAPPPSRLRRLDLSATSLDDEAGKALAGATCLAGLERIDVSRNAIGLPGAEALLESPHLARATVALGAGGLSAEEYEHLCRWHGQRVVYWFCD